MMKNLDDAQSQSGSGKLRILVVEDSRTQAEYLRYVLEKNNYDVSLATTGEEALARLVEEPPGIVISDIVMPEMDGYQFCKHVKSNPALEKIPVILLTSLSDPSDVLQALESGANGFVVKPFDEHDLLSQILHLLSNEELRTGRESQFQHEILFRNRKYSIRTTPFQILDLLLFTYENAVKKNAELIRTQQELKDLNENLEEKIRERTRALTAEIAERKRAEEEARKSESRFRRLFDSNIIGIIIADLKWNILEANHAFLKIIGYTRDQLVSGKIRWEKLTPPENRPGDAGAAEQLRRFRTCTPWEKEYIRIDGSRVPVFIGATMLDEEDDICIAFVLDRSELKHREETLRKSEERYRLLFEESLTGNYLSTPDGILITCNLAFARMFGFPSIEEALHYDMKNLYPERTNRENFLNLLRSEKKIQNYEIEMRRRDGKSFYGIENVVGIFNEEGQLTELRGFLVDTTERKALEEQLLQSQKMEAIGQLAGGVAHDFNNILMAIMSYGELLLSQMLAEDPLKQFVLEICKTAERGAGLTRQLLAFSRKQVFTIKNIDLCRLIENMKDMLQRLLGENVKLVTFLPRRGGLIQGDEGQIEQVIMNLAVNARDAMPLGGTLTLLLEDVVLEEPPPGRDVASQQKAFVKLTVRDCGHGMDKETLSRVFEPFFTTKEEGKGTGLGLSTTYGIVKQSGGKILVSSEINEGTTFEIYFPRLETESVASDTNLQPTVDWSVDETILIVDDNESVRVAMATFLELKGFRVLQAESGEQALDIAASHEDLIRILISDVVLPDIGGYELARLLAPNIPDLRILFISGYTHADFPDQMLPGRRAEFLQKPASMSALLAKINELLA